MFVVVAQTWTYRSEERLGHETCSCIEEELHLRDLLVHLLHELYDKVDQFMLQHLLGVKVRDQEGDVVALHRFPPQNVERLGSLRQESRELVYQYVFNLIRLLDLYAYPHAVDTWLDEDPLVLIPRNGKWVQDDFWRACRLDFRDIVSFRGL